MKNIKTVQIKKIFATFALGGLIFVSRTHPLFAQTTSTQGYKADTALQRGMVVQLDKADTSKVKPLTNAADSQAHGVVVNPSDVAFTISDGSQSVFVSSTGQYPMLVSDQNGSIGAGDYVAISALEGIGMKASNDQPQVIGKSLATFSSRDKPLFSSKVKDSKGVELQVNINLVMVDIAIASNPLTKADAKIPDFLKRAAQTIAKKEVGVEKLYASAVILMLTAIVAGIILYAGIRTGIAALGRNPMSRKTIFVGMIQSLGVGVVIFVLGLVGVYLLLKV